MSNLDKRSKRLAKDIKRLAARRSKLEGKATKMQAEAFGRSASAVDVGATKLNKEIERRNTVIESLEPYKKDGGYDVAAALRGGVADKDLKFIEVPDDAINEAKDFNASHTQIATGDWVTNEDYEAAKTTDLFDVLNTQGIQAYNEAQEEARIEFETNNVLLGDGQWIPRVEYEQVPVLYGFRELLGTEGIDAYNKAIDAYNDELEKRKANTIELGTGEVIDKATYESLSEEGQKLIKAKGIDVYNKMVEVQNESNKQVLAALKDLEPYKVEVLPSDFVGAPAPGQVIAQEGQKVGESYDLVSAIYDGVAVEKLKTVMPDYGDEISKVKGITDAAHDTMKRLENGNIDRYIPSVKSSLSEYLTESEKEDLHKIRDAQRYYVALSKVIKGKDSGDQVAILSIIGESPTFWESTKEFWKRAGISAIPVYGTIKYWDEMSGVWKAISVLSDVAIVLPVVKGIAKGVTSMKMGKIAPLAKEFLASERGSVKVAESKALAIEAKTGKTIVVEVNRAAKVPKTVKVDTIAKPKPVVEKLPTAIEQWPIKKDAKVILPRNAPSRGSKWGRPVVRAWNPSRKNVLIYKQPKARALGNIGLKYNPRTRTHTVIKPLNVENIALTSNLSKRLSQPLSVVLPSALTRARIIPGRYFAEPQLAYFVKTIAQELGISIAKAIVLAEKILKLLNTQATPIPADQLSYGLEVDTVTDTAAKAAVQSDQLFKYINIAPTVVAEQGFPATVAIRLVKGEAKVGEGGRGMFPIALSSGEVINLTQGQLEKSYAWRQGIVYKLWYPPFKKSNLVSTRDKPPFVQLVTGKGSASRTLTGDRSMGTPKISMGIVDVQIKDSKTSKPHLVFTRNKEVGVTTSRR